MSDIVLNRLRRCLVEALERRDHDVDRPLKVAQLYEELVPYREVRPRLGVELNADYEHALLRLLAGEGGMLRMQPAEAQEELRREAAEPYPFVGLFRKFAGCDVWVESMEAPGETTAGDGGVTAPAPEGNGRGDRAAAGGSTVTGSASGQAEPVAADEPPVRDQRRAAGGVPTGAGTPLEERREAVVCGSCREPLPQGRRVRYCPHCGSEARLRPCPRCDELLEEVWRFCIGCGHDVASDRSGAE